MSTVINTNIAATRTHNVYNRNNDYMNQALSRVATGMKVNSAKDNASTWAISEKMRERIRANNQANQNVQNDTALLKTAEGGISNTIDILKTLKERAVNAANDSNMNTDRSVIAEEVRQLVKQIDDNAEKVKFNGRTLLKGTAGNDTAATLSADPDVQATSGTGTTTTTATPTAATNSVYTFGKTLADLHVWDSDNSTTKPAGNATILSALLKSTASAATGDELLSNGDKIVVSWKDSAGADKTSTFTLDATAMAQTVSSLSLTSDDSNFKFAYQATANTAITDAAGNTVKAAQTQTEADTGTAAGDAQVSAGFYLVGKKDTYMTDVKISVMTGSTANSDANSEFGFNPSTALTAAQAVPQPTSTGGGSSQLTFHIGGEQDFSINMTLNDMTSTGSILNLGSNFAEKFLNATDAKAAIDTIDDALNAALKEQTRIGAYENRLGYTSDNLVTMNENLEAADSVMRDSDIAKEMTQYMKYSVLAQASQYMLAQAGQNAFSVLNLLQA